MASPTLQFGRVCEVDVGKLTTVGGKKLVQGFSATDLFRIQFEITKTIGRTPNSAKILIYNLTPDHEAQVGEEFTEVALSAGYARSGGALLIFRGNIRRVFRYRQVADQITELDCGDGDKDFNNSTLNVSLAAGTSTSHMVDKIVGSFDTTTRGAIMIDDTKRIRGRVLTGNSRDTLDGIAADSNAHWSIQDGELQIVPVDKNLPDEAIVMRSDTGMVNAPELSDKGIKVRCLLNPRLKVNGIIHLDNNDLKATIAKAKGSLPGQKTPAKKKVAKQFNRLDPDGFYKCYKVLHHGDSRGTGGDWYSEVSCLALSRTTIVPKST
jgi:hypothetical protein